MVWCVTSADDPVAGLTDAQRIAVLNTLLPDAAGTVVGLSPLKQFPLGLNAERTLTDGARHTAASVREFNAATEHLRDAVGGLRNEISRFRVSE